MRENVIKHYRIIYVMENNVQWYRDADEIEEEPINVEIQEEIRRVDAICLDHNTTVFTFEGQTGTIYNMRFPVVTRTEQINQIIIEFYKQHPNKLKELENIDFVTLNQYRYQPNSRAMFMWSWRSWHNLEIGQNHFYRPQMILKDEFQHLFSDYVLK